MLSQVKETEGLHILNIQHIRQKERYDCGAGALSMVLNYWGHKSTSEEILKDIFSNIPPKLGMTAEDLKNYAERKGFNAFLLKFSLEQICDQIDKGRPIIVCRKIIGGINHYEVVIGYDSNKKRIIIDNPAKTPYSVKFSRFSKRHKKVDYFTLLVASANK